jgi:processive 1,2-diacylglycerol beta-glucosyltransferase
LPIIVINPIPGQEEENAEFLENKGVAIWIRKTSDLQKELYNILNDSDKLQTMKINARLLAKKNSTKDICQTLLNNM